MIVVLEKEGFILWGKTATLQEKKNAALDTEKQALDSSSNRLKPGQKE